MKPSDMPTCPTCGHVLRFEQYQPHGEVARLLCVRPRAVLDWIRAGEFGQHVVLVGRDYMIPISGFHQFCQSRAVFCTVNGESKPVVARTEGELRRKAHLRQFRQPEVAA